MKSKESREENLAEIYHKIGPYMGLGTQLALTIVLMFFLGKWLDAKFSTYPVLLIIFTFLGCFAGMYNFIKVVLNLNKKKIEKDNDSAS